MSGTQQVGYGSGTGTGNNRHALLWNGSAESVVDHCEKEGLGFIPWFPIASGKLLRPGSPLVAMASAIGATPSQVALAWLLRRSTTMLPIPGTSSVAHLDENCLAGTVTLTDAQFGELSELASPAR